MKKLVLLLIFINSVLSNIYSKPKFDPNKQNGLYYSHIPITMDNGLIGYPVTFHFPFANGDRFFDFKYNFCIGNVLNPDDSSSFLNQKFANYTFTFGFKFNESYNEKSFLILDLILTTGKEEYISEYKKYSSLSVQSPIYKKRSVKETLYAIKYRYDRDESFTTNPYSIDVGLITSEKLTNYGPYIGFNHKLTNMMLAITKTENDNFYINFSATFGNVFRPFKHLFYKDTSKKKRAESYNSKTNI